MSLMSSVNSTQDPRKGMIRALKSFVEDRPGHDQRYAIDASKIQSEIGWTPEHDLASGLALTVAWYLENGAWCEDVQSGSYNRERLGKLESTGEEAS